MSEIADDVLELARYAAHPDTAANIVANICRDKKTLSLFTAAVFRTYWSAATLLSSDLGMLHLRDWLTTYSLQPDGDPDLRLAARVILAMDSCADTGHPDDELLHDIGVTACKEVSAAVNDTGRATAVVGGIACVFAAALPILLSTMGLELLARCADAATQE